MRPYPSSNRRVPLGEWLAAEPFTLVMSSGFFGFFAHAGVLTGLLEAGCTPARVQGSSAGALVTSLWAAGLPPEHLTAELMRLERKHFWDPRPGFGLLRGKLFDDLLRTMLPETELSKCRVPAGIAVFDVLSKQTETLTSGDIPTAIRASCAVPVLFQPVWIDGRPKLDGGILDRPGLHGLEPGERVLHHHLLPTSPWRSKKGPHGRPPRRDNLRSLAIHGLPLVTPYTLWTGRVAFQKALAATRRALIDHETPQDEGEP